MNIAIIPARGGSKRIPKKNIKLFNGKPMLSRAIEVALASQLFDRVIVSTECLEISEVAIRAGAETPFLRPDELSNDTAATLPVVKHAIEWLMSKGQDFGHVCCIYPCTPFLLASDIIEAFKLIDTCSAPFIYPVVEFHHPIERALVLDHRGVLTYREPEHELSRTQDLAKHYHDAGQFYLGSKESWLKQKNLHSNACGLLLPSWRMIDIDTSEDWKRAELIDLAMSNFIEDSS